jgi:hypothetical protein
VRILIICHCYFISLASDILLRTDNLITCPFPTVPRDLVLKCLKYVVSNFVFWKDDKKISIESASNLIMYVFYIILSKVFKLSAFEVVY